MFPKWHVIYGALFTLIIFLAAPHVGWINLVLIFLASFLIDFDHYINAVKRTKKLGLREAWHYHMEEGKRAHSERAKGIRRRGDFHLFHTIEFHALIAIIGIFFSPFFYIFIGMVFHNLLDVMDMAHRDFLYRREYFLTKWISDKVGELE